MSIEETNTADIEDTNLDDFSAEFFGQNKAPPEKTKPEVEDDVEDEADAPPEADQDTQDEEDTDEDEETEEEEEPEEEAPKPKKNRVQERISELTAARREAERRAEALEQRLAALEGKVTPDEAPKPEAPQKTNETGAPTPTDKNEDGTDKFPLGEFDPAFITALTTYNVEQALAIRDARAAEEAQRAKQAEEFGKLEAEWNGRLETARERYPDFDARATTLEPIFSSITDPSYSEYLSSTLMSMENGADIIYYLADHPDQAQTIANAGPREATLALGRIQAQFDKASSTPARKVSKAPSPPPTNKGSSTARGRVSPTTDDLDAFSEMFFNTKK